MRYGYIMEGITPGTERMIAEKMLELGCETIVQEKAYNGFIRAEWNRLSRKMQPGDELVCYDLAHIAADNIMLRELELVCSRKGVALYTMKGLREGDGLINQSALDLLDAISSFLCGKDKRMMSVVIGLREQVKTLFCGEKKETQDRIYASFCLAQGISEGYFYQAIGKDGAEYTRRTKKWMEGGYREELKGAARTRFEQELEQHLTETRRRTRQY